MGDGNFLLVSNDHGYLREQVEIEGLNGHCVEAIVPPQDLSGYALILINRLVLKKAMVRKLFEYAAQGGTVIAIRPCENFEKAAGVTKTGEQLKGWMHDDSDGYIYQVFDVAKYHAGQILYPLFEETGTVTDQALISMTPVGTGRVFLFAFDLSQTLFSLLQGRDLLPHEKDPSGIPRVDYGRLVETKRRFVPQADGLRRILIRLIEDNVSFPIPRLWYFPHGAKGGIAFTHDSDASKGPDIESVNALNLEMGVKATTFMKIVDGNPRCWKRLVDKGCDLQLHPILSLRQPAMVRKQVKKLAFKLPPMIKKTSLLFQKCCLEYFSTQNIIGVRNHGLVWPKMADGFDRMSRLGISYDSTMGSNHYFGYMYGTGLPYHLRLPGTFGRSDILEFPMHIMDSVFIKGYGREWQEGACFSRIKCFLKQAIEKYHSLITLNFHYFFLLSNHHRLNNLELYKQIIRYVKQNNIYVTNLTEFNTFWRKRLRIKMVDTLWDKIAARLTFDIRSKEKVEGLTFLVPTIFNTHTLLGCTGKSLQSIFQNGREYQMVQVDLQKDSPLKIIAQYSKS